MSFSPSISRLLAISLVILPILFLLLYVLIPMFSYYNENNAQISHKRFLLARYLSASTFTPQQLAQIEQKDKSEPLENFLQASSKNIALANLQSLLKQLAARYQTSTLRANQLPDQQKNELTFIGVRIEYLGKPENIMKILHAIEKHRPFLFVHKANLSIRKLGANDSQNKLHSEFSIYGAYWPRSKKR